MCGKGQVEQVGQNVGLGERKAGLLQEGFEILLRTLLAMEADQIGQGLLTPPLQSHGALVVGFRLGDPFSGQTLHTEPCPHR